MVAAPREAGDRQLGCSVDDFVGARRSAVEVNQPTGCCDIAPGPEKLARDTTRSSTLSPPAPTMSANPEVLWGRGLKTVGGSNGGSGVS